MTMESKAVVYAVLAVALGYLLISAVPNQLVTLGGEKGLVTIEEETQRAPPESLELSGEKAQTYGDLETQPPPPKGLWREAAAIGVWIIDLLIALGAYFAARRWLS